MMLAWAKHRRNSPNHTRRSSPYSTIPVGIHVRTQELKSPNFASALSPNPPHNRINGPNEQGIRNRQAWLRMLQITTLPAGRRNPIKPSIYKSTHSPDQLIRLLSPMCTKVRLRPILMHLDLQSVEKVPFSASASGFSPKTMERGLHRVRMKSGAFSKICPELFPASPGAQWQEISVSGRL